MNNIIRKLYTRLGNQIKNTALQYVKCGESLEEKIKIIEDRLKTIEGTPDTSNKRYEMNLIKESTNQIEELIHNTMEDLKKQKNRLKKINKAV